MARGDYRIFDADTHIIEPTIYSVPVDTLVGLDGAFATAVRDRAGALIIVGTARLFSYRKRIGELALKHRLPTVVGSREYVEAGGLASYGTDFPDLFRRAAPSTSTRS